MKPVHEKPAQARRANNVERIRHFSRFYTQRMKLLGKSLLESPFSITEARVLYELAQRPEIRAADLVRQLELDAGYLSRVLNKLARARLISRRTDPDDARQHRLSLTRAGVAAFDPLNKASQRQVSGLVEHLGELELDDLAACMRQVELALDPSLRRNEPVLLREHRLGDVGWIARRQGLLYAQEYGWDESFEALVAEIAAQFVREFDPKWERAWIAEQAGQVMGSVFLVRQTDQIGKLRLLYVEPAARGQGLGRRLVDECIREARHKRYKTLTLWTNDVLSAARRIYIDTGFKLITSEAHRSFGKELIGEHWNLDL